jgi:hypothetical protein
MHGARFLLLEGTAPPREKNVSVVFENFSPELQWHRRAWDSINEGIPNKIECKILYT